MKRTWNQKLKQIGRWFHQRLKARKTDRERRKKYAGALVAELNQMIKKHPDVDFGLESCKKYVLNEKKWTSRQRFCLLTSWPAVFIGMVIAVTGKSLSTWAIGEPWLMLAYVMIWGGMALLFPIYMNQKHREVGYSKYYIKRLEMDFRQMTLMIQLNEIQKQSEDQMQSATTGQTTVSARVNLVGSLLNAKHCTSDADLLCGLMLIYQRLLKDSKAYGIKLRRKYCLWTHYEWCLGGVIAPAFATLVTATFRPVAAVILFKPLGISPGWSWIPAIIIWVIAFIVAAHDLGIGGAIPLIGKDRAIDILNREIGVLARKVSFAQEAERQHLEKLKTAYRALEALIADQLHGYCEFSEEADKPKIAVLLEDLGSWQRISAKAGTVTKFKLTDKDCQELTQIVLMNLTMAKHYLDEESVQELPSWERESTQLMNQLEALRTAYENNGYVTDLLAGLLQ